MCCILETDLMRKFAADLSLQIFLILYLLVRLWWNIPVANLVTDFQDLVTKVKNLVALAPVLGAISHPEDISTSKPFELPSSFIF